MPSEEAHRAGEVRGSCPSLSRAVRHDKQLQWTQGRQPAEGGGGEGRRLWARGEEPQMGAATGTRGVQCTITGVGRGSDKTDMFMVEEGAWD
jgi:hypothetical protein